MNFSICSSVIPSLNRTKTMCFNTFEPGNTIADFFEAIVLTLSLSWFLNVFLLNISLLFSLSVLRGCMTQCPFYREASKLRGPAGYFLSFEVLNDTSWHGSAFIKIRDDNGNHSFMKKFTLFVSCLLVIE